MSEVIYRKYRPSSFDQVIGLESTIKILQEQIKKKQVSHAYLFAGPRGTGKTSIARIFASELNQNHKSKSIELNIIEIDAASNRGIDEIRQLKEKINFMPVGSVYKVYIIDEVHMLTTEAFNALLKTLEEPPAHIVFIFATTEPEKVPVTVLSRVVRFDFKLATNDEVVSKLEFILKQEKIEFEKEALLLIASHASGSFRDAESILGKVITDIQKNKLTKTHVEMLLGLVEDEVVESFVKYLLTKDLNNSIKVFHQTYEKGFNIHYFIKQVIEKLRIGLFSLDNNDNLRTITVLKSLHSAFLEARRSDIVLLPYEIAIFSLCENETSNRGIQQSQASSANISIKPIGIQNSDSSKIILKNDELEEMDPDTKLDFDQIKSKWSNFLDELKNYNHHLTAFFSKVVLEKMQGGDLCLNVAYQFHKKKLEDIECRKIVDKVSKKLWGCRLHYKVGIDKNLSINIESGLNQEEGNSSIVEKIFEI